MNLFSKLKTAGSQPNTLEYGLPQGLRVQILRLWEKGFGPDERWHPGPGRAYEEINQILCEEHQLMQLPQASHQGIPLQGIIAEYFMNMKDTDQALDVVQVVFHTMERLLHRIVDGSGDVFYKSRYQASEIIDELNQRFQENNVGYKYVRGRIEKIPQGAPPMPLKERLVDGEPARNLQKIADIIGTAVVTAVHDPYTTTRSLDTMLKLADMGAKFSPSLRILGSAKTLSKPTEKKSFISLLKDINSERKVSWEARIYPASRKPHRRFLMLQQGSVVTCGMSLNGIDKDEVLDHEVAGSENAQHDHKLFEQHWKTATAI